MDRFPDQDPVRRELLRGKEMAERLRNILPEAGGAGRRREQVGFLVDEICGSFARALDALSCRSGEAAAALGGRKQIGGGLQEDRRGKTVETSTEHSKDNSAGGRRRDNSNTQTIVSAEPFEDGHFWKKYGQKKILGATYPRSYFKCSQNKDQGCQAMKQVQKTEDDPPMFTVTYIGQHTCAAALYASEMDGGSAAAGASSSSAAANQFMLSFDSEHHDMSQQVYRHWSAAAAATPDQKATNYDCSAVRTAVGSPAAGLASTCPMNGQPNGVGEGVAEGTDLIDSMVHLLEAIQGFEYDEGIGYERENNIE